MPVNIVGMRVTYATENGKKCQENKIQKIIWNKYIFFIDYLSYEIICFLVILL